MTDNYEDREDNRNDQDDRDEALMRDPVYRELKRAMHEAFGPHPDVVPPQPADPADVERVARLLDEGAEMTVVRRTWPPGPGDDPKIEIWKNEIKPIPDPDE